MATDEIAAQTGHYVQANGLNIYYVVRRIAGLTPILPGLRPLGWSAEGW